MKELELLMSEIYDDDIPAESTVVEVANISSYITAMLSHESVDANGNANDDLTRQFSVDQPLYCDKKSADQAIVS